MRGVAGTPCLLQLNASWMQAALGAIGKVLGERHTVPGKIAVKAWPFSAADNECRPDTVPYVELNEHNGTGRSSWVGKGIAALMHVPNSV